MKKFYLAKEYPTSELNKISIGDILVRKSQSYIVTAKQDNLIMSENHIFEIYSYSFEKESSFGFINAHLNRRIFK